MKVEIKIPAMGESISEATVGEIFKPSGALVSIDDELLELETDKVNQVLYAPKGGALQLSVKTGDVVSISQIIGHIDTEKAAKEAPPSKKEPQQEEASLKKEEVKAAEGPSARLTKEQYVRELSSPPAKEREEPALPSVPKSAAAPASEPAAGERVEVRKRMSRLRQVLAKRLVDVQAATAMLTTFNEVDMTEVMALRQSYQEKFVKGHGVKLGLMSFFVKASVSALKAFPEINAYIDGTDIVYRHYYDISIAVATEKGLVVPVVRECDRLGFAGIEKEIVRLAEKARGGNLALDDLQGGGFTITNGGIYGSLLSTPILNPPQSGILGMQTIQKRPIAIGDQVVIRPMMYLALSYDHRIVDGKEAVSFLIHIKNILEDPARLLLEV